MRIKEAHHPVAQTDSETTSEDDSGRETYRQRTFPLGHPRVDLDKASVIAGALEDEEILRKMSLRK